MRFARLADEAHAPRFEIGKAADIIVHDAVGGHRKRVHGEVAPLGVGAPVAAEAHIGVAAEGLDVLAQRRDFERPAVDHDGDGAVLDAGRHRLEARRGGAPDHLLRAPRWWRCRIHGSARRAARCAPRRRPRAPLRRRGRAPASRRASAPSRSHAASFSDQSGGSLTAPVPARNCRVPRHGPARRSSPAARRRNAPG